MAITFLIHFGDTCSPMSGCFLLDFMFFSTDVCHWKTDICACISVLLEKRLFSNDIMLSVGIELATWQLLTLRYYQLSYTSTQYTIPISQNKSISSPKLLIM